MKAKRLLLMLTMLLSVGQFPFFNFQFSISEACAQSMSDEQVVEFIKKEQAAGKSQSAIVSRLMSKGVTTQQLQRIRKKADVEYRLSGNMSQSNMVQDEAMTRMRSTETGNNHMTRQQQQNAMSAELAYFVASPDSIDGGMINENQVFGRNIFNNELLTFEPNQNMATPANYRLGAGDRVIIDVWGASQETFEGVISPDGYLVVEGVGPIKLAGQSVSQATATVRNRLGRFYSGCNINLALGDTRSIQVQVIGEVRMPGTYTLSSLSTAFNALYAAGGISDIGTLRDIKVYRKGRLMGSIDVYDYLLNGNANGDIHLQDNDVISVDAYECLVCVRGKVKRPMFYEMKRSESVLQVLKDAGGFTGDAYTKHVRLTRKTGSEYSIHTVDEFQMSSFTLMDGDSIFVDSVIPRFSNMVEVRGAVMHAGQYELGGAVQTVRGLLQAAEGLREDAYQTRAVMHREKDDLSLEMISVDIEGILNGTVADVPLKKNDVLYIPSLIDMKGEQTLNIRGEVLYPGSYKYAENTSVEDLILMAGGLTPAASMAKVDVYRRVSDPNAVEATEQLSEIFSVSLNDGLRAGDHTLLLQPYDLVVVRKSPAYSKQENVSIQGCVNFEGNYAMSTRNYRLSDLIKSAGGVSSQGYAKGARLTRQMTEAERLQRENSLRAAQIQMYEEALQSEKGYDMARADSLMNLKIDMEGTYPVAINLEAALANPGGKEDMLLREGDLVVVPQFSNTVQVNGEVPYPSSMNYEKGKKLSYYIKRAGGYGNRAKKKGTYAIYMNGGVKKINKRRSKDIQPGCEIVVPTKAQKNKMSTGEIVAVSSGAASLASVVVALISVLRK